MANREVADYNVLQSKVINELKFILIVLVVLIHCTVSECRTQGMTVIVDRNTFPVYWLTMEFLSNMLSRLAVPLFFFISGYLFFIKTNWFSLKEYFSKMKKRFNTLFIPYVLWNILCIIILLLAGLLAPSMMSGENKSVLDWTALDWCSAFWSTGGANSSPIDFPLWFLRDLIILVILSPIFYYLIKYVKWIYLFILLVLWVGCIEVPLVGISMQGVCFFSFGAYMGLNKMNIVQIFESLLVPFFIIYVLIVSYLLTHIDSYLYPYMFKSSIVIGVIMLISFVSFYVKRIGVRIPEKLKESTFFLYAYHGLFAKVVLKIMLSQMAPVNEIKLFMVTFLTLMIVVMVGYLLFFTSKKCLPVITSLLTGNRA